MKKFFGFFLMACVLLVTGCKDDRMPKGGGEEVTVQFTISAEQAAALAKRQGYHTENGIEGKVYYPGATDEYPQISDGSKANLLVYAVYDNAGELVESLGEGYVNFTDKEDAPVPPGQTIRKVDHFPVTITLRLIRNQTYTIAFWAQAEECTAFDTQDLKAVKIKYQATTEEEGVSDNANTLCNYELRDAFCKSETFTVVQSGSRYVVLNRPFAQINVGITKADYEAAVKGNMRITQSRIHIENVATELNVVSNAINTDPDKIQAIDYEFNTIPAYVNYSAVPTEKELKDFYAQNEGGVEAVAAAPHGQEQFLKVDLNRDGKIAEYGKKNNNENNPRDETYKYMMMCYVLPADRTDNASTYSTTLDKVVVTLKDNENGREFVLADGLENLPIQRNWRTNIVGDLLTSEINLIIDVDPIYSGDYNAPDYAIIAEGVSYDAKANVIYLSNAKGLQWLSDASNGVWPTKYHYMGKYENGAKVEGAVRPHPEGNVDLFLEALGFTDWPDNGIFYNFSNLEKIELTNDVDWALAHSIFGDDIIPEYWTPISLGDEFDQNVRSISFKGNFDGGNHTISNLKTVRLESTDQRSMGFFSELQAPSSIRNVRLFNIDMESHYRTGGICGYAGYGEPDGEIHIENCYVDQGQIIVTPVCNKEKTFYDNANNIGGIVGQVTADLYINECNVRHLTIRGYRVIGGILGSDTRPEGGYAMKSLENCKVSDVTLIADQFNPYGTAPFGWVSEATQLGAIFGRKLGAFTESNNEYNNVRFIEFHISSIIGGYPDGTRTTLISNVELDIIPRLQGDYAEIIQLGSSIMGNPVAYKSYKDFDNSVPTEGADLVGMYVKSLVIDGKSADDKLDHYTVTVNEVANKKVTALYLIADPEKNGRKNYRRTGLRNIAIHGNLKVNEGVCLVPNEKMAITLENVSVYDAQTVLTDNGDNAGVLYVKNSNFRGNIDLKSSYSKEGVNLEGIILEEEITLESIISDEAITFNGTVFEPATDNINEHTFKSGSKITFENCTFKAPYTFEGTANFVNCKVIGTNEDKYEELNGSMNGFNYSLDYVTGKPKAE